MSDDDWFEPGAPPALEVLDRDERRSAPRPGRRRLALAFKRPEGTRDITEGPASGAMLGRDRLYRRSLALADMLAAAGAMLLALGLGEAPLCVLAPLLVVANKLAGLYDRDELVLNKVTLDEAPALLQMAGLFTLGVWILQGPLLGSSSSRPQVVGLWLGLVLLLLVGRHAARAAARRLSPPERCLVVGPPATTRAIADKLRSPVLRAHVVGRLRLREGLAVRDVADRLPQLVDDHDVHRLVISPPSDGSDTLDLVRAAKASGVRVSVLPRLLEVVGSSVTIDQIEGLTMLGIRSFGLSRSSRAIKRCFDLLVSSVLLLAVAPFMAAIALAVRLDSPGPLLFRQTRVGRDGKHFDILKFRSMVDDAEARKADLMHLNETHGLFKLVADPRVTRVGRLLRATSLDELPQLLNVWRGEMSVVGPRPLIVDEDAKIGGHHRARLHLTPGMTGHWQILGSARVPLEEMAGIDYLYVANWSLWTDVKILLRTVPYVLSRSGV
jgi:exopolysaccharide biosynthesis polyprenyl glycosylphosphotransferase